MGSWKPNPSLKKALSRGPREFAVIVLPLIKRYGDGAKKLIYDILYEESHRWGVDYATKVEDTSDLIEFNRLQCDELDADDMNSPGFDDPARGWKQRTRNICCYTNIDSEGCEKNIPGVWKDMGLDDETIRMLGEIRCIPFNLGIRKGFNPKMEFRLNQLVTRGDPCCEYYEELKE